MGIEIERKYLVKNDSWKAAADRGRMCRQGYLLSGEGTTVRVRLIGENGFLTVKGPSSGISRAEFEYEIPASDADALLALCGSLVEKIRYYIHHAGMEWELDVFTGANAGLILAEIELETEAQAVEIPDWAGEEVSTDGRYHNAYLAAHPFTGWN
jgi:adenylate cyclase